MINRRYCMVLFIHPFARAVVFWDLTPFSVFIGRVVARRATEVFRLAGCKIRPKS